MGAGKGSGGWEEHVEVLQYVLYVFNTIFFCAAAAIFAVGLWARFDEYTIDYIEGMGMNHYWVGTSVIMAGAALVMVTSFLGCCGAFFRSVRVIFVYKVMTVITFLLLLGGSAYLLDHGLEQSKAYEWIQVTFREKIHRYQWDVSARRTVDMIQEQVGCCGGYSSADFSDIHMPVPDTCRDQITGNQFSDSCAEIFSQYLEVRTGWMTGLSLSLCFLQLFAVLFAFCMWQGVREAKEERSARGYPSNRRGS